MVQVFNPEEHDSSHLILYPTDDDSCTPISMERKVVAGEGYISWKEELPELWVDDGPGKSGIFFGTGSVTWGMGVVKDSGGYYTESGL